MGDLSVSFIHLAISIYDSGDDFERITSHIYPDNFNSDKEENTFDTRSDDKGPGAGSSGFRQICGMTYAFIGLERIGGIMVYDITNPFKVKFNTYIIH